VVRAIVALGRVPFACLVIGCGNAADIVAARRAGIIDGEASGVEDDAVVATFGSSEAGVGYLCTGALIAPNLLVTAVSCISAQNPTPYTCTPDGELENEGSGGGELGELFPPERIEVGVGPERGDEPAAFGESILGTGTTIVYRNDLAFVVLDRSLEGVPILPVRLTGAVQQGDSVTAIGYGLDNENSLNTRLRADALEVLEVGVPPRTFTIGSGPCFGDFGGPALSTDTGAVVGVLSLTYGDCKSDLARSVYTELAPFEELALQAFEAAGAEPLLERSPETGSSAGASKGDSDGGCALGGSPGWSGRWVSMAVLALLLRRVHRRRPYNS
jgi:hypothetical protein